MGAVARQQVVVEQPLADGPDDRPAGVIGVAGAGRPRREPDDVGLVADVEEPLGKHESSSVREDTQFEFATG